MELTSDTTLWNEFRRGDYRAFSIIYSTHIGELLSYGYRITSDRQLIKDTTHDLFLHIWLNRERLSETNSIRYYLFRSLRNRLIDNIQPTPETRISESLLLLESHLAEISWEDELIERETGSAQIEQLRKAIDQLPPRQQEAIQLRYFHSFGLEEIASMLQMNNQSVRNLLHRALNHLRDHFEIVGAILFSFLNIFI